jgi:hypothetical protein
VGANIGGAWTSGSLNIPTRRVKGATMAIKSTGGEAFVMSARLAEISELVTDLRLSRVMLANDARFPWLMFIPRRANGPG